MTAAWRDFPLYNEDDEQIATFGETLDRLRTDAPRNPGHALDEGIGLALALHSIGLYLESLEALDELTQFLVADELGSAQWAWTHNTRGLALSGLGRLGEAEREFGEMARLGTEASDPAVGRDVISTAQQNHGILLLDAGEPERASELLRESLRTKYELEDWFGVLDVMNSLALAVEEAGDVDSADDMLSEVERIARQIGDSHRLSSALGNRGRILAKRGNYAEAEAAFRVTLSDARREGDITRELLAMLNLGSSLADQGRAGEALRWYRRAARLAAHTGATATEIRLRRSMALMLLRLDRKKEALTAMQEALWLAREIGHPLHSRECLADVGSLRSDLGDRDGAQVELEKALEAFVAVGDREWQQRVDRNLAEIAIVDGRLDDADRLWRTAIELESSDAPLLTDIAHRAAEAFALAGDHARAVRWVEEELKFASRFEVGAALAWRTATAGALLNWPKRNEAGLRLLLAAASNFDALGEEQQAIPARQDAAAALADLRRFDEAIDLLASCLSFAARRSDRVIRQTVLANRGEVRRRKGELDAARGDLEEAVTLARALADDDALSHALGNLALVAEQQGDLVVSANHYQELLRLARKLGLKEARASAFAGLATLDFIAGRYIRAASKYRRAATLWPEGSGQQKVEALGGELESLASARRDERAASVAQELVDFAQAHGYEGSAASGLARGGRVLLVRDPEAAADLYAASLQLAVADGLHDDSGDEGIGAMLGVPLGLMAAHVEVDLPKSQREPFYALVMSRLDDAVDGIGELLMPFLRDLIEGFGDQGLFDALRRDRPDRQVESNSDTEGR
jgi:tetratricopeptide (TPR) repeat protein